jgi:hypothetical protein
MRVAWQDSGVTARVLATILVSSTRYTILPLYHALRELWRFSDLSSPYAFLFGSLYFAFWVWLVVLLCNKGKSYPGIALDAVCGGTLFAVAFALHDVQLLGSAVTRIRLCTLADIPERDNTRHAQRGQC